MKKRTYLRKFRKADIQAIFFVTLLLIFGGSWFAYAEYVQTQLILKNAELDDAYKSLKQETDERLKAERELSDIMNKLEEVEENIYSEDFKDSLVFRSMQLKVMELKKERNKLIQDLGEKNKIISTVLAEKEELRKVSEEYKRKYEAVTDKEELERLIVEDKIENIKADFKKIRWKSGNEIELVCNLRNWREYGAYLDSKTMVIMKVFNLSTGNYICPTTSLAQRGGRCYSIYQGLIKEDKDLNFTFINTESSPFKGEMNNNEEGTGFRFEVYLTQYGQDEIEVGRVTTYFQQN